MFDVKCYDFAKIWLSASGWNHEMDIGKLAQRIQDLCEEFEADLDEEHRHAGLL